MDAAPDEETTALVGDLVQAARVPAKQRPFPVKPTVARLTALAYEHGLRPAALRTLVGDVLTAPGLCLDQASLGSLVRSLYPVPGPALGPGSVPSADAGTDADVGADVILAIVGCLGQGQLKPPLPVQALLLRWLVLVYHVLAAPARAVLARAYAVLFNLLDTAGIRPQLCHVLALITRRKHVRPFRIQAILSLSRQTGHDPHLLGLLRVFKNYYPEVIVGAATRGRASPFKHPDPQWRAHLDELRRASQSQAAGDGGGGLGDAPGNGFRVRPAAAMRRGKGGATAALPAVHTMHAQEASVTLEEIDSATALVQNLESIELPSQLVAVLADPLLQKLLLLRPADDAFARVDHWLAAAVSSAAHGDGDGDGDGDSNSELMDMLEVVHDYISSTRTSPPVFHRFFGEILRRWDGRAKKDLLLDSLAYVPVTDFQETYNALYGQLEARLLDNDVASQIDLLSFYTLVLQQWEIAMAAAADEASVDEAASVQALVQHVNRLVLAVLQNSPDSSFAAASSPPPPSSPPAVARTGVSTPAALAAVDFYEQVIAVLKLRHAAVLACVQDLIPPPAAVYLLHFHQSVAVASRLYAVLAEYKRAMEAAMARRPSRSSAGSTTILNLSNPLGNPLTDAERVRINLFNGYLMDICNCLWRSRAFSAKDTNALGCRMDGAVVAQLSDYVQALLDRVLPLTAAFNLSHAPTLCLQAISYLRLLEEEAMEAASSAAAASNGGEGDGAQQPPPPLQRRHAGPVTQAALLQLANAGGLRVTWQAYRSGLLVYLEGQGFDGIAALMYNTMKNLMNARAA